MLLRQTLAQAVDGYWDGGKKRVFDWTIDNTDRLFSVIGSWNANYRFRVRTGRTERLTLSYAKQSLRARCRYPSTFTLIEDKDL
jgi:hypothetical protein